MRWLAIAVLLLGCRKKLLDAGDDCTNDWRCSSNHCVAGTCTTGDVLAKCGHASDCNAPNQCFKGACRALGKPNEACNTSYDCTRGLFCIEEKCLDDAAYAAYGVKQKAAANRLAAEKEKRMLDQAGVPAPELAEAPAGHPPGPGTRVRTVTIAAETSAFAACKSDERLIGGGCKTKNLQSSYPSGQGAEDTVGARWNCVTDVGFEVIAYALCSKL